eukprot:tig00020563_g11388.t1
MDVRSPRGAAPEPFPRDLQPEPPDDAELRLKYEREMAMLQKDYQSRMDMQKKILSSLEEVLKSKMQHIVSLTEALEMLYRRAGKKPQPVIPGQSFKRSPKAGKEAAGSGHAEGAGGQRRKEGEGEDSDSDGEGMPAIDFEGDGIMSLLATAGPGAAPAAPPDEGLFGSLKRVLGGDSSEEEADALRREVALLRYEREAKDQQVQQLIDALREANCKTQDLADELEAWRLRQDAVNKGLSVVVRDGRFDLLVPRAPPADEAGGSFDACLPLHVADGDGDDGGGLPVARPSGEIYWRYGPGPQTVPAQQAPTALPPPPPHQHAPLPHPPRAARGEGGPGEEEEEAVAEEGDTVTDLRGHMQYREAHHHRARVIARMHQWCRKRTLLAELKHARVEAAFAREEAARWRDESARLEAGWRRLAEELGDSRTRVAALEAELAAARGAAEAGAASPRALRAVSAPAAGPGRSDPLRSSVSVNDDDIDELRDISGRQLQTNPPSVFRRASDEGPPADLGAGVLAMHMAPSTESPIL